MYNYAIGNFDELLKKQRQFFADATMDAAVATPAPALSTASSEVAPAVLSPTISSPPRTATVDASSSTTITPSVLQVTSTAPVATKATSTAVSKPRYVPPAYARPIEDGGVDVNEMISSGAMRSGGSAGLELAGEANKEVKKSKSFLIWGLLLVAGIGAYVKYS